MPDLAWLGYVAYVLTISCTTYATYPNQARYYQTFTKDFQDSGYPSSDITVVAQVLTSYNCLKYVRSISNNRGHSPDIWQLQATS
jgi:hypothetical protein